MIPLWLFIIACLGFLGIMIHAYFRMGKLEYANKEKTYILDCYFEKYGMINVGECKTKMSDQDEK